MEKLAKRMVRSLAVTADFSHLRIGGKIYVLGGGFHKGKRHMDNKTDFLPDREELGL